MKNSNITNTIAIISICVPIEKIFIKSFPLKERLDRFMVNSSISKKIRV